MAQGTVSREPRSCVRRIVGSREVRLVTAIARRRQVIEVVVCVTLRAAHRCVRSRQGPVGKLGMVEIRHRRPGHICMAGIASGREVRRNVTRIIGAGEISLMAAVAVGGNRCVVVIGVALGAGQRGMEAQQREHRGVIEGGRSPISRGVAERAIGRKASRHVSRIGCSAKVCLVARVAIRGRTGENIIDVARRARNRRVCAGERERGVVVIKDCPCPRSRVMAYDAVGREIRGNVIGIGRPGEIRLVTGIAIGRNRLVIAVDVALHAGNRGVGAR